MHRYILDKYFFETAIPLFFSRFTDVPSGPAPAVSCERQQLVVDETQDFIESKEEIFLPVRGGML
jgi:hypothetical protein